MLHFSFELPPTEPSMSPTRGSRPARGASKAKRSTSPKNKKRGTSITSGNQTQGTTNFPLRNQKGIGGDRGGASRLSSISPANTNINTTARRKENEQMKKQ